MMDPRLYSLDGYQPAKMQKRMDQQAKKKELEDLRYAVHGVLLQCRVVVGDV